MAAFTLATGLRQSNVSWLRWDQVDLERRSAWIHADQSKSRRAIAVPLNEDAMSDLTQRRGIHPVFVFFVQMRTGGKDNHQGMEARLGAGWN